MNPIEQFGRVFWAGFEQLAAAGEAADAQEQSPAAPAAAAPAQKSAALKAAAQKPAQPKPAQPMTFDTDGSEL
jgi:hypothetical protein